MDDIIGKKIGRLVVIGFGDAYVTPSGKYGCKRYKVKCECGKEKDMTKGVLLNGKTKSCGCYSAELARINGIKKKTHGETKTRTYKTWIAMKSRCNYEKADGYYNYGGRGISVCKEWADSYEAFVLDMGHRPIGKTLDRIDNNSGYNKDNCRWATYKGQAINRKTTKLTGNSISEICNLFKDGKKARYIADLYGITFGYVYTIVRKQSTSGS